MPWLLASAGRPRTPTWSPSASLWPAFILASLIHALLLYSLDFRAPSQAPASGPLLAVVIQRQPDTSRQEPATAEPPAPGSEDKSGPVSETLDLKHQPEGPGGAAARVSATASDAPLADTQALNTGLAPEPSAPSPPSPPPRVMTGPEAPGLPDDSLSPEDKAEAATRLVQKDAGFAATPPPSPPPGPPDPLAKAPRLTATDILASRGQEIARLTAKIDEETTAYAHRPRRKAVTASTQEYQYASYLEAWRRKVEAIGNLNYPEEARRLKLYGSLILQVALRADGTLEEVRVLRSSGSDVLDQAAVRIVHLAAPFAPFPPEIRKETDFLDITRTWQFLTSNRFGQGN